MLLSSHIFAVFVFLFLVYFLWMDLALYYKLQTGHDELLTVQVYRRRYVDTNLSSMAYFDPFNPISVKLLMLDHTNHYGYYSVVSWLDNHLLHLSDRHPSITPDMISWTHVIVALMGAKCLLSESLSQRRIGVLLFELRSLLDSYDGMVARARSKELGMAQVSGNWGYYMDGVCDAIGTVFFFVACWFLLQKRPIRSLDSIFSSAAEETSPFIPISQQSARFSTTTITVVMLLLLQFFSSLFWNRYLQSFHQLLEVPAWNKGESAMEYQVATLKSSTFWIISWSWKIMNPHSQMSFLLWLLFFDFAGTVFARLRFLAYVPLFALVVASECHLQSVIWQ